MKIRFALLLLCFGILSQLLSQTNAPQGINYQAVLRANAGALLSNQQATLRMGIRSGSAAGTLEWQETHVQSSNDFGLVTAVIGQGSSTGAGVLSAFDQIDWAGDRYWLQVELDTGTGFVDMGTTPFYSVPYALTSQRVIELPEIRLPLLADVDTSGIKNNQVLKWSGTRWIPRNDIGGGVGDDWGSQVVARDLTLRGDGSIFDQLGIAQQGATEGEALLWTNGQWQPGGLHSLDEAYDAGLFKGAGRIIFADSGAVMINSAVNSSLEINSLSAAPAVDISSSNGSGIRLNHSGSFAALDISADNGGSIAISHSAPDPAVDIHSVGGSGLQINQSGSSAAIRVDASTGTGMQITTTGPSAGLQVIGKSGAISAQSDTGDALFASSENADSSQAAAHLRGGTDRSGAAAIHVSQGALTVSATGDQFVGKINIPITMQWTPINSGTFNCTTCAHEHAVAFYQDVLLSNAYISATNSIIFLTVENAGLSFSAHVLSKTDGSAVLRVTHIGQMPPLVALPMTLNYMIINKY